VNEETQDQAHTDIPLTERDYQALARMLQWPEDLPKWDVDNTPTNMASILGRFTTL